MKFTDDFLENLKKAENIGILTGAGISADSGIQTFRGKDGFWQNHEVQKLATLNGFLEDPELVWKWYNERRVELKKSGPNKGHTALAEMEKYFESFAIITQNVDNLHQAAGSNRVIELHGNIWELRCMEHGEIEKNFEAPLKEIPPKCENGGIFRPNVVWFGEPLPQKALDDSFKIASQSDMFFVIGTSAVVQPAASIPIIAKRASAYIVEINLEETPLTPYTDISFQGKSKDILPKILDKVKKVKG